MRTLHRKLKSPRGEDVAQLIHCRLAQLKLRTSNHVHKNH